MNRNPLPCLLMAALALCMVSAQAQSTLRDDRGVSHRFERPPQRIVSLLPSLTETVCALGACDRLVGTDRFSNAPASVLALPKLGGMDDTPIERIVALQPDVVLAAKSSRVADRLEALGLKVLALESQSHADVRRTLGTVALLLGRPEQGDAVWAAIEQNLLVAAARVPQRLRGRKVYFEVASAPYAAGAASFIGETLTRLGLGNVVPAEMGPFPKLNPEFVVRAQPEIMMASAREMATLPGRPGWGALRALQQGQRCAFAEVQYEMLIRPGPRLGEAARVLVDCLVALPPS